MELVLARFLRPYTEKNHHRTRTELVSQFLVTLALVAARTIILPLSA